jgi:hypothetical protein
VARSHWEAVAAALGGQTAGEVLEWGLVGVKTLSIVHPDAAAASEDAAAAAAASEDVEAPAGAEEGALPSAAGAAAGGSSGASKAIGGRGAGDCWGGQSSLALRAALRACC